ncbi:hypothetical protein DL96DRAFT_1811772 [Flagelloscypha sp. PMI_526]|nr:hypothetical protein DL96DRAFT_1811772 [Flagelloscypha sp. PMI_526]
MANQLPTEIWASVYALLTLLCASRKELASYLVIHKLSYQYLRPRLFETILAHNIHLHRVRQWQAVQINSRNNDNTSHTPVRRVYLPSDGWSSTCSMILRKCSSTIERFTMHEPIRSPEDKMVQSIANLSHLQYLEIHWLDFVTVIQAANPPPLWFRTLTHLVLRFQGLAVVDASQFTSVQFNHFTVLGTICLCTNFPNSILPDILPFFPPILSLIVVLPISPRTLAEDQMRSIDPRVVYYVPSQDKEAIQKSIQFLKESPVSKGTDSPLDDWMEITTSKRLHFWSWALEAKEMGKKTFSRPVLMNLVAK